MLKRRSYIQDYSLKKLPHQLGGFDEQGIPLYDPSHMGLGKQLCYHPTVIIQYALACYERMDTDEKLLSGFLSSARWIETHTETIPNTGMIGWAIPFSIRTPFVQAPWFSSLTQSQGISVLVRLYEIEKRPETLEQLRRLAQPLVTNLNEGGMLYRDQQGNAFFEEAGQIHILNGCLTTLYGLLELQSIGHSDQIEQACSNVQRTLEKWLPQYDTGYWSRYSIGLRFNMADMHYHLLHIRQLHELGFMLHSPVFLRYARKWNQYTAKGSTMMRFILGRWLTVNMGRVLTVLRLNKLKYKS